MVMEKSILIAGGSGFVGQNLAKYLVQLNYRVGLLCRSKIKLPGVQTYFWDPKKEILDDSSLKNQQIIVNLSGTGIADKFWTKTRKKEIIDSRIDPLEFLFNQIMILDEKPEKIISASAIGYYGHRPDERITENSTEGTGFLSQVCLQWENTVKKFETLNIPTCIVRIGVVLSQNASFVTRIQHSQDACINLIPGNGNQLISWISLADLLSSLEFLIKNESLNGIFNLTHPEPYPLKYVQTEIARFYKKKTLKIHFPAKVLKFLLGSFSELFLNSQSVVPERLIQHGYHFSKNTIEDSLR
jgi:uncharacterized protein